jgi:DNA phosphorothioation-associated putative methyltransferase
MVATVAIDTIRYQELISSLPYGKRLPSAVYLHRDTEVCASGPIGRFLQSLAQACGVSADFNIVKFRTDVPRLSFLSYPDFFEDPHPALEESISIDLTTGKTFRMGYRDNINPPILHRKELFLSTDHSQWALFAALSAEEERAGLFENTSLIGFRLNWERLLASRGLTLDGHHLEVDENWSSSSNQSSDSVPAGNLLVQRHRTALTRYDLSKPVKTLFEFDQLRPSDSFFDYGCGLGADVRALGDLGYDATGWDPVHAPTGLRSPADVVNLGYVLNVIEDPAERVETLISARRLARRLLVVSALIGDAAINAPEAVPLNDGILTRRNTFQKYFSQRELQHYIEDALDLPAVPVAVGIFYVFSDPTAQELFVQSRSRRTWKNLGIDLGIARPSRQRDRDREQTKQIPRPRFDPISTHRELVAEFWSCVLNLGRLPLPIEFSQYAELCAVFGSAKRALRYALKANGMDLFTRAEAARRADLLVYLSMAPFRKVVPFSLLPETIKHDIHTFFGNYKSALAEGRNLLYSAGDSNSIGLACEETETGWQDDRSLYVHTGMLDRIPSILRTLVACAESLFGNALDADIVRIHKRSFKVTFLVYSNFSSSPLPRLAQRARVNLRTQQVDVFDHSREGQLLYFKERFVSVDDDHHAELERLSTLLRHLGISEDTFLGPSAGELAAMLKSAGHSPLAQELALQ